MSPNTANGTPQRDGSDDAFRAARLAMVEEQIRARGIRDEHVLNAMQAVPRHQFVVELDGVSAYNDNPLPIGFGQTISQPYIVALMTQALDIGPGDRVLEIGTGSGYQTAVLSLLAVEVFSIEFVEPLGRAAARQLSLLGYDNVNLRIGDGYEGWPEAAPFDGVIVTAAPEEIPEVLIDQLGTDGRLVVPVGLNYQELILVRKDQGGVSRRKLADVRFVPMVKRKDA